MFEKIVYIGDENVDIKLNSEEAVSFNLMNLHLILEDKDKVSLAEVDNLKDGIVRARLLGEIVDGRLVGGVLRKPTLDAKIRVIDEKEIPLITGIDEKGYMYLGDSPFYNGHRVFMDVNGFFSNHFAIFGNTGSGKSCGVSRVIQNMFEDRRLYPYKANMVIFDSSGEYYNAFKDIGKINPNFNYRFITTNQNGGGEELKLPVYLLNAQDWALLLDVDRHSQLPIIERMLKLARIFSEDKVDANAYKNHLISTAIQSILFTNQTAPNQRNDVFAILRSCSTPEFNMESPVQGIGYVRKLRECFEINRDGTFAESTLLNEYLAKFTREEFDNYEPTGESFYNLETVEKALNFTLISEGWLRNEETYGDAVTIRVRLHSLIVGPNSRFFDVPNYMNQEQFLSSLLLAGSRKYQIVNINLDDVDDVFAKTMVKIFSRLIFDFSKALPNRASIPFHLIIEEAHRYIQSDGDVKLFGYNIFERIAKEGRKYGVIMGIISQRPCELSDTVISQTTNFLIFKMSHPVDIDYIKRMVPNISEEVVEKQKSLQSGTCLAFGQAFRIPLIVRLKMPDPMPKSSNCNVVEIWNGDQKQSPSQPNSQAVVSPQYNDIPQQLVDSNVQNVNMPNIPTNAPVAEVLDPDMPQVSMGTQGATMPIDMQQPAEMLTNQTDATSGNGAIPEQPPELIAGLH